MLTIKRHQVSAPVHFRSMYQDANANSTHALCATNTLSPLPCCSADQDATHIPVQHRQIGMVFQSYALFRHMTVADNISFGPRIQDLDIDEEAR